MKKRSNFLVLVGVFVLGIALGVGLMCSKMVLLPSGDQAYGHVSKSPNVIGPLIELGEFTVNLNGGGVLKTFITIEGYDQSSSKNIQEKEAFLTDRAITVLSSQKVTEVSQAEGREKIKSELLSQLNEVCNNEIKDVLFISFVYSM